MKTHNGKVRRGNASRNTKLTDTMHPQCADAKYDAPFPQPGILRSTQPTTLMSSGKLHFFLFWIALITIQVVAVPWRCAAEPTHIVIGSHLPLSGPLSSIGIEQRWAYEAAVEDVNGQGGIFVKEYGRKLPIELIVVDDESDPGRAAAAVERLIKQDKADFILSGHSGPYGVIPGCVAAEKNHKYYHATACFIPPWQAHQFQWSTLLFIDIAETAALPFKLLDQLPERDRPTRIATFMEDTFDGRVLGSLIRQQGEARGYHLMLEEALTPGAENYSPQILKAKALGIDAVLFFTSTADGLNFIRQMKADDFSAKFIQGWKGMWPSEVWKALGQDAQYIVCDGHWSMEYPFSESAELGKRYYQAFGSYSVSVGAFYALAQILWQAIEKAGSLDSAKVRQAVLENEFTTVMGRINYDEMGVAIYPAPAFQWIDGKQVLLLPPNVAHHTLQLAPPWDQR